MAIAPLTPEEQTLLRQQSGLLSTQQSELDQQLRIQNLLAPFLFRDLGLDPIMGNLSVDPRLMENVDSLTTRVQQAQQALEQAKQAFTSAQADPFFGSPLNADMAQNLGITAPTQNLTRFQNDIALRQNELDALTAQLNTAQGDLRAAQSQTGIVGFNELPQSPEALRQQQLQDLLFQQAQFSFDQEQAAAPLLAQQRDLQAQLAQRSLAAFDAEQAARAAETPLIQQQRELQNQLAQRSLAALDEEARLREAEAPLLQQSRELQNQILQRSLADLESQAASRTQNEEIEGLLRQRTLSALKGELPVNPALQRELLEGEELLRTSLTKQLGPGYETSTPGIQALAEFSKRKSEILEGARRGDLQLSEQLGFAREAARNDRVGAANAPLALGLQRGTDLRSAQFGAIAGGINPAYGNRSDIFARDLAMGVGSPASGLQGLLSAGLSGAELGAGIQSQRLNALLGINQAPLNAVNTAANLANSFGGPLGFFGGQRQLQMQDALAQSQLSAQRAAGRGQLFGTVLGLGIMGALSSDRRLKEDVAYIGTLADGINIYSFRYIGDDEDRIGVMADEVEEVRPEAIVELPNGYKLVKYGELLNG